MGEGVKESRSKGEKKYRNLKHALPDEPPVAPKRRAGVEV